MLVKSGAFSEYVSGCSQENCLWDQYIPFSPAEMSFTGVHEESLSCPEARRVGSLQLNPDSETYSRTEIRFYPDFLLLDIQEENFRVPACRHSWAITFGVPKVHRYLILSLSNINDRKVCLGIAGYFRRDINISN